MSLVSVRKIKLDIEDVHHEGGPGLAAPLRIAVAMAVVQNPYAGRYEENLLPFMEQLRALGGELSQRLITAWAAPTDPGLRQGRHRR